MAAPTITSVTPTSGRASGGVSVALVGTGFTGATAVKFGTRNAKSFKVNSDTSATAVAPSLAAGQLDVTITTPGGTSATGAGDKFTFVATYTKPGGQKDGTKYFMDVVIGPASLKDGTLAQRFDPVLFPQPGAYGVAKVGTGP